MFADQSSSNRQYLSGWHQLQGGSDGEGSRDHRGLLVSRTSIDGQDPPQGDLTMTTADFDARLTRLEDIEEIKQLKARYCAYCDDGYDPNGIAALFTEDGIWDGGRTFGKREGRDAIHRHFEAASQRISIARHQVMNPIITIDGDEATADWLLFQPCTITGEEGEHDQALWLAATYHDQYRRVEGTWMISAMVIDVAFFTPFDTGWAKQQFLPGREP